MAINTIDASLAWASSGSGYLSDTSVLAPPSGRDIVAIVSLEDATQIATLVPINYSNSTSAGGNVAHVGTTAAVTANGANGDAIPAAFTLKAGVSLVGRWSAVSLTSGNGSIVAYYAPSLTGL